MYRIMDKALHIIASVRGQTLTDEQRRAKTIELAALILQDSDKRHTRSERKVQAELSRMMRDESGKAFTTAMTDQCFRSSTSKRVASQMCYLLRSMGVPKFLGFQKRIALALFKLLGRPFAVVLVPFAKMFLRKETNQVIIPGEKGPLARHIKHRKEEEIRLNINHLGEAILGEEEAIKRLNVYLHDLMQDDIDYVSVKISTVFSQINLLANDYSMKKLADRLRQLYRTAMKYGVESMPKFVNLDMEEYKDLHLTKDLFMQVLSEEEFKSYSAGIVLQAYLPDSFDVLIELIEWAKKRVAEGGAPVKVRIVKGANMTMEQHEASLRGWEQAPYNRKVDSDANYKRMLTYACQKENAAAVNVGVASHNIFDIAYALLLRSENEVEQHVVFEMLEGMANHLRRVLHELSGSMLLYCAVATKEDFQSAIAYLIRRLDENTGKDNFLAHSFGLKFGSKEWEAQEALFKEACNLMETVRREPRREQNRTQPPKHLPSNAPFENEPDTDFSLPHNRIWAEQILAKWENKKVENIGSNPVKDGVDPSKPGQVRYRFSLMTWEEVDQEIESAVGMKEPYEVIRAVAEKVREKRGDLIGAMVLDGGKTVQEADVEISEAIDFCEYYIRSHEEIISHHEVSWAPKGIVLVTPPWNFPFAIPLGGVIAALVCGNACLLKPAANTFLVGQMLAELLWEAGVPKEALKLIACDSRTVGTQLIQDERINTVILTGATATALKFLSLRPRLNLYAETGGKNAMIITALADRDLAIKELVHSAFGHNGQKCSAASLAILEKEVYDDPHFLQQLKDAAESLCVGSAWDISSKMTPLVQPPDEKLLKGLTTLEEGEDWLLKPRVHPENPCLWSPGIKIGVTKDNYTQQTEFFGPVLGIIRAENLQDAIDIANSTSYGLTSGLQSLDRREQRIWERQIVAGNCYINRGITGAIVRRQPFGGTKRSCFGRGSKAGGPNYLAQFMFSNQLSMPKQKHHVNDWVNNLTKLLEKIDLTTQEQGIWFASIANYSYWWNKFKEPQDLSKIVGQDNYLKYLPHENMHVRINRNDRPLDYLRIFAAALTCHTRLHVSIDPSKTRWKALLPIFHVVEETEEAFIKRLHNVSRIRVANPPSDALATKAAEIGCHLDAKPVLASGRFELLHYIREMAVSTDYHRYGNLGTRENEIRSKVL
ncbi:MAG: 1-pyrroline-5-carboxylate dehydrogenase [Chlamydiia bacterium]|nr:1-pyrroline-5-carboxylate dehydrogenase [Chlamydiia bacterium]MCH9616445.1 1-pyrroline-5-carboxylate dehydrogenase [Chlamydiia bacterium]MCH9629569.1 1-pyrroline-5-carboxylate dehydrogenase [Chlamydiia bacterium]